MTEKTGKSKLYLQRKLTERGRLVVAPNGGSYVTVEGCTVGFCVAGYEGTSQEQGTMETGKFAVEALVKVRAIPNSFLSVMM